MATRALRLKDQRRDLFGVAQALLPLVNGAQQRWIVMVSGIEGGEGATTVARNLAEMTAREFGAPVCLVRIVEPGKDDGADGPPRRASIEADGGEVLLVEMALRGPNALPGAGLREALGHISQYARIFLVDGPPILESLDAGWLCREVDGLILVAEAERTTPDAVDAARAAVESYGGRVIGGVLNKRRRRLPAILATALGGAFRPRLGPAGAPRDESRRR